MTYNFKTKYPAFIATLLIGMSNVYADESASSDEHAIAARDSNGSYPEKYWASGMNNAYADKNASTDKRVVASRGCHSSCHGKYWVSADLLFLTVCEGGFGCDFGTTTITTSIESGKAVTAIAEKDSDLVFDWNLGFRIGTGYDFSSCWDLGAYWTHFHANGNGHENHNHAKWKLRFNEVDAVLGYKLKYGARFGVRPFVGARYARINQTLSTHLESAIIATSTGLSSVAVSTRKDQEHFWGAGPLLGFEGDFYFGCNFSLYGTVSGNFLYGHFHNKFNDSDEFTAAISSCHSKSESCAVLTGFDAGVGMRYEINRFLFQLGWEHHTYFDYNQISCSGDLSLYGVNASATVRF